MGKASTRNDAGVKILVARGNGSIGIPRYTDHLKWKFEYMPLPLKVEIYMIEGMDAFA